MCVAIFVVKYRGLWELDLYFLRKPIIEPIIVYVLYSSKRDVKEITGYAPCSAKTIYR